MNTPTPAEAFSEFVVQHAITSMSNQQKIALADGIRSKRGGIQIDRRNIGPALNLFWQQNHDLEGQIEITTHLLRKITIALTERILREADVLGTATAIGRRNALFTGGPGMDLC